MKKILTFTNFMVLLGIMTILFYLIPAINIAANDNPSASVSVNLFDATFGGSFTLQAVKDLPAQSIGACGGLIAAFALGVVAILLTLAKAKFRFATLLACPFYVAAGVLVACAGQLAFHHLSNPFNFHCSTAGGAITVATFWCILGFFALIDFIATVAKPKQQTSAY